MKLSGKILSDALNFALSKGDVLKSLGPVDSLPSLTIGQITTKVSDAQEHEVNLEICFQYNQNADGKGPAVVVLISWYSTLGFVLKDVRTMN